MANTARQYEEPYESAADFSQARRESLRRPNLRPDAPEEIDPLSLNDQEFIAFQLASWGHPASINTPGLIEHIVEATQPVPNAAERVLLPAETWQLRMTQLLETAPNRKIPAAESLEDYFADARRHVTTPEAQQAVDIIESFYQLDTEHSPYILVILAAIIREEQTRPSAEPA